MHWEVNTTKRRLGTTIRQNLKEIGMSWEEAQEQYADRKDWYVQHGLKQ